MFIQFTELSPSSMALTSIEHFVVLKEFRINRVNTSVELVTDLLDVYYVYCNDIDDCSRIFTQLRGMLVNDTKNYSMIRRFVTKFETGTGRDKVIQRMRQLNAKLQSETPTGITHIWGMQLGDACAIAHTEKYLYEEELDYVRLPPTINNATM